MASDILLSEDTFDFTIRTPSLNKIHFNNMALRGSYCQRSLYNYSLFSLQIKGVDTKMNSFHIFQVFETNCKQEIVFYGCF